MDRFQEMQVFVRIAERGSFSQAAEDLQIPRATVTNLIKRLEQRLGVRLLERTTRQFDTRPSVPTSKCAVVLPPISPADLAKNGKAFPIAPYNKALLEAYERQVGN